MPYTDPQEAARQAGLAADAAYVAQHSKSIALIRAMRPRALPHATHHAAQMGKENTDGAEDRSVQAGRLQR